jgi:hypothetical protein
LADRKIKVTKQEAERIKDNADGHRKAGQTVQAEAAEAFLKRCEVKD